MPQWKSDDEKELIAKAATAWLRHYPQGDSPSMSLSEVKESPDGSELYVMLNNVKGLIVVYRFRPNDNSMYIMKAITTTLKQMGF